MITLRVVVLTEQELIQRDVGIDRGLSKFMRCKLHTRTASLKPIEDSQQLSFVSEFLEFDNSPLNRIQVWYKPFLLGLNTTLTHLSSLE